MPKRLPSSFFLQICFPNLILSTADQPSFQTELSFRTDPVTCLQTHFGRSDLRLNRMLVPPDNFGLVEPGVYRCSKLEADHTPFLATLQLNSIVLLDAAKPPRNLKVFLEENGVKLFKLGGLKITGHGAYNKENEKAEKSSDSQLSVGQGEIEVIQLDSASGGSTENNLWMLIEQSLIEGAFEIIFNKSRHNVLVVDLSLTLVGILRRIQKWNFNSIINEYRIYTGNSSKNNYNAENFLELIEVELIPFEVDQWLRNKRERSLSETKGSLVSTSSNRRPRQSVDEGDVTNDDGDISADDYEDDADDDLLLASPQIPANLLKLVEQRKNEDHDSVSASPGTPPEHKISNLMPDRQLPGSTGSRNSSFSGENINLAAHRRKLSIDPKITRPGNLRFRKSSFEASKSPGRRPSFETSLRHYRLERERSGGPEQLAETKELYGYHYYKPRVVAQSSFVEPIKLHLPPEHKLPEWFVRGRDFWENQYKQLNP